MRGNTIAPFPLARVADSGACRSVIPIQADHGFRRMPIADSDMPIT